jgi:hypothetical protein
MSDSDKKPEPAEPAVTMGGDPPNPPAQPAPDLDEAEGDLDEVPPEEESSSSMLDDVDVRDLLRSALAPPPNAPPPDILRGVQRKLRNRSRGKFYGDGWSTARSPRSTYLFTSILMLALIGLVFLVLIPWGSGALP